MYSRASGRVVAFLYRSDRQLDPPRQHSSSERAQEVQHVLLLAIRQLVEIPDHAVCLGIRALMCADGRQQIARPPVMQEKDPLTKTPKRRRCCRHRASPTGPFKTTNGGRAFCAPLAVATATCGLLKGLVPPIAGDEWHMKQLSPLKAGPKPRIEGLLVLGSLAPSTLACSPKTASEANQKAVWSGVSFAS